MQYDDYLKREAKLQHDPSLYICSCNACLDVAEDKAAELAYDMWKDEQ